MPITCRLFWRLQCSELNGLDLNLVGYLNNPLCGEALLSGNGLNSFDSAFLSSCAITCLITTGALILATTLAAAFYLRCISYPGSRGVVHFSGNALSLDLVDGQQ